MTLKLIGESLVGRAKNTLLEGRQSIQHRFREILESIKAQIGKKTFCLDKVPHT